MQPFPAGQEVYKTLCNVLNKDIGKIVFKIVCNEEMLVVKISIFDIV